jgi:flagellar export protein FliJ
MAFQFSLGTVLRVRGIVEEREERLLQRILFEITQTHENVLRIDAEISKTDDSRRAEIFRPSTGHDLHASYQEAQELKQRRREVAGQIEKLEQLRDKQFVVYAEARRNREMLTDMREEKRTVYDVGMARSEQKTLDDNYIARRGRI